MAPYADGAGRQQRRSLSALALTSVTLSVVLASVAVLSPPVDGGALARHARPDTGLLRASAPVTTPMTSTPTPAIPACTRDVVLTPVADTWAWRDPSPLVTRGPARGAELTLVTGFDSFGSAQVALIRFALHDIGPPEAVVSAYLRTAAATTPAPSTWTTRAHLVLAPWEEGTLTDFALPQIDLQGSRPDHSSGAWSAWDVTTALRAWAAGRANHGFALVTTEGMAARSIPFHSREGALPPELVVRLLCEPGPGTPSPTPTVTSDRHFLPIGLAAEVLP
jgi:hypothetical protein